MVIIDPIGPKLIKTQISFGSSRYIHDTALVIGIRSVIDTHLFFLAILTSHLHSLSLPSNVAQQLS